MELSDKISVIVPVYNVEKYIKRCIESILGQTYANLEIILIDDGSQDGSGAICESYAELDNRVRVVHKVNEGLAEARNVGLRLSKGAYFAFIDSDDYIEPDMLEVLHRRIRQDDADLAICNFGYVDENGVSDEERNRNLPVREEVLSGQEAFGKLASEKYWYYVTAVNKLYRKEVFKEMSFPKGKFHEDEFAAHYILGKCRRVSCVGKVLYFYVQREKSIMNQTFSVKRLDVIEALCDRVVYAKKRSRKVAEFSLILAGNVLVDGYRKLGKEKTCRDVLKGKRRFYRKTVWKSLICGGSLKNRLKVGLISMHPCVYVKMMDLLRKGK